MTTLKTVVRKAVVFRALKGPILEVNVRFPHSPRRQCTWLFYTLCLAVRMAYQGVTLRRAQGQIWIGQISKFWARA